MCKRLALVVGIVACGGGAKTTSTPKAPTPVGGWTSPNGPLGPMLLCVVDHGFGVTKLAGDRTKRSAKAAGIALAKGCTWADDGTGHCSGSGLHTEFDLTWKLAGDELTLSRPSDLTRDPVTFQRDLSIDCSHPTPPEPDPSELRD